MSTLDLPGELVIISCNIASATAALSGKGKRFAFHLSNYGDGFVDHFILKKNVVFWDIKTQFVLHRRYITSPLESPAS
jgi:hypothetical protein